MEPDATQQAQNRLLQHLAIATMHCEVLAAAVDAQRRALADLTAEMHEHFTVTNWIALQEQGFTE